VESEVSDVESKVSDVESEVSDVESEVSDVESEVSDVGGVRGVRFDRSRSPHSGLRRCTLSGPGATTQLLGSASFAF